ncbi:hypothetical protein CQ011_04545 [Arthrobacter sp. MYb213]|nr:hypothetical protein CQ011_04545 [Arthrobacter sp. MYb213]
MGLTGARVRQREQVVADRCNIDSAPAIGADVAVRDRSFARTAFSMGNFEFLGGRDLASRVGLNIRLVNP